MNKLQRKTYTKPILNSEAFVPNEYVAACETHKEYGLKCETSRANAYEESIHNDPYGGHRDRPGNCGNINSQKILTDSEGIIKEIYELYEGTTRLDLELVGGTFIGQDIDNLAGQEIRWRTYLNTQWGNWTYNHIGTIQTTSSVKVMS